MRFALSFLFILLAGCLSDHNKQKIEFYDKCHCDCFERPQNKAEPEPEEEEEESDETEFVLNQRLLRR